MAWSPGLLSLFAFANTAAFVALAVFGSRNSDERYAEEFAAVMVMLAGWSLAYGVQLGFDARGAQLAWWGIALTFSGFAAAAGVLFLLRYAGGGYLPDERMSWLAMAEPAAFGVLTLTNRAHGLVWTGASFDAAAPVRVVGFTFGIAYYAHVAYVYLALGIGAVLVVLASLRSDGLYRRQTFAMVTGLLPPVVGHLSFSLGVSPIPNLDPTPFVLSISAGFVAVALFRFDLMDRMPVAREAALNTVGDGLVVLDADGTVVDIDECARHALSPTPAAGDHISVAFPETPISRLSGMVIEGASNETGVTRVYEMQVSDLRDAAERLYGYSLVLRDVTDRHAYQQRLKVANRVLRHNLRNDMNVVQGLAGRIASGDAGDTEATAERIRRKSNRVIETSEKVREMTRLDPTARNCDQTVDLAAPAERAASQTAAERPDATVKCDLRETRAVVADEGALLTALENLLDNAVEHNDNTEPTVRVRTERRNGTASVCIEDDGPGIPPDERQVLRRETETPLEHSRGLGLWLAYWSARTAGGNLEIEASGEDGSTVRLDYPAAPD
ncbi:MAG: histidine kinase N-terminal 7TM domain-containing protein [Halolamina sp.]